MNTGIKPYASVTSIHTALDCLKNIMEKNNISVKNIKNIKAKISHPTYVHCWNYKNHNITSAQMNIYYGLGHELFVNQFSKDKISNPKILNFMKKITAEVDPKIESLGHEFRHMASDNITKNLIILKNIEKDHLKTLLRKSILLR